MDHRDHLGLIRAGVEGAGPRWLELGCGDGAFTLALADLLGGGAEITALDRDRRALDRLADRLSDPHGARLPASAVRTVVGDFTRALPAGPFDGVLAANSLHFVTDPVPVFRAIRGVLVASGPLVLVEYDAEHGNPYVPYPIPFRRLASLAVQADFEEPRLTGRVPSRFLGSIYGAVMLRAAGPSEAPAPPAER